MNRFAFLSVLSLLCLSCSRTPSFRVTGQLSGAEGKTLFFEHLALGGTQVLDSVVLHSNGHFRFRAEAPKYPDLYRLRVGTRSLVLAVDSVETLSLSASLDSLSYASVAGSPLTDTLTALRRALKEYPPEEYKAYARRLILSDPRSLASYFALFQQRQGTWVFNPYDTADRPCFAAVATSWHVFMPDYERSRALYNLMTEIIGEERRRRSSERMQQFIADSESAFLDLRLPDINGDTCTLSSLRGKVILLDFSAVATDNYTDHIFSLRSLWNELNPKGLEIYSVSADRNRILWEDAVRNLPWTCVCPADGLYDAAFRTYNVQQLPTLFLINQQGEVVSRFSSFETLREAILKCLN